MTQPKQLLKTAALTDIHWGAKNNSEQHLQDCDKYIDWFCENVKKDPTIDSIVFLGDWYENRSALNIMTLSYSHRGAQKLNALGLPVYFIIGNHDLYHKHTRALYSTITFENLPNFIVVNEPTVFPELGVGGALVAPFLFHEEYANLAQYRELNTWWGHFEFKGFVVTGYNMRMPTGPEAADFAGPKRIFSGHFHKRQSDRNIHYIGNTFPTNYGDADDDERGMMIYDHTKNKIQYLDWEECPKYRKAKLSDVINGDMEFPEGTRLRVILDDKDITAQELNKIRAAMMEAYKLREFTTEEDNEELEDVLVNTETDAVEEGDADAPTALRSNKSIDELVIQMLSDISSDSVDKELLIAEYKSL